MPAVSGTSIKGLFAMLGFIASMKDSPKSNHVVRPIGAITPSAPTPRRRSLSRDIDGVMLIMALMMACLIFALSAYFFYGFTQTDQGIWTLTSAFGLCFGVGSLAYVPLFMTAAIARRSAKGRASRKAFALVLLLFLPWICVSLVFIGFSALPKIYGICTLLISTSLCFWAFKRLRQLPRP